MMIVLVAENLAINADAVISVILKESDIWINLSDGSRFYITAPPGQTIFGYFGLLIAKLNGVA